MEIKDLNPEMLEKAAVMLKALAHPIRISIIDLLANGKKLTVTEIHKQLDIEQSAASHHLVILKDKGILTSRREGKYIFYYLKYEVIRNILTSIGECCRD